MILVLFMLNLVLLARDLTVSAAVDRNRINLDEVISFTVTIEGTSDFPDVAPPQSDGFVIISGPSQSSSIQIVNGAMSASKTIQWRLAPTRTGEQTIRPIDIKYRRKTYSTNAIIVTVNDAKVQAVKSPRSQAQGSGQGSSKSPSAGSAPGELFLKAEVPKTTIYKGEELPVSFNLYFQNVRNYAPQKLPDAKGFWTELFPEKRNPTISTETINGVAYKKATLRRLALFPTTTGDLTIDPMQISCEVPAPTQRRRSVFDDFFNDSFFSDPFAGTKTVQIQSEPLKIRVRELPETGKPAGFNGAVGNYVIESSIDTLQTHQNQALTLRYSISGSGNINAVKLSALELPSNVEIFEPKVERRVNNQGRSIRGSISYEYVLIPRTSGRLRIPALNFSFFDPVNGRYQTSTAKGYAVNVKAVDQADIASSAGFRKEEISLLGSDIRFISRDDPHWRPIGSSVFKRVWFWFFNLIALGLITGSSGFRWWMEKMAGNTLFSRRRRALSRAQQLLKEVQMDIDQEQTDTVCGKLDRSLSGFIADRLGLAPSGVGPREIQTALRTNRVVPELIETVATILNELEQFRFLPGSLNTEDYKRLSERVDELLQKLIKVV